jgi:biopolymer transport protein ExbD
MRRRRTSPAPGGLSVAALAPFVDLMTLLLVFLLRTWASEPAPTPPSGDFALPRTRAMSVRQSGALTVLVTEQTIHLEGRPVAAAGGSAGGEVLVRELYEALLARKGSGPVEVHADARVTWSTLRRVLHTARAAGRESVALVGARADAP